MMKIANVLASLVVLMGVVGGVQATPTWSVGPVTIDANGGSWDSSTPVPDFDLGQYAHSYEITSVMAYWGPDGYDVTSMVPSDALTGSGIGINNGSGFVLVDDQLYVDNGEGGFGSVDILLTIDGNGYGHLVASNFNDNLDLSYITLNSDITVASVPEPVSLMLLGLGVVPVLRRRLR